MTTPTQPKKRTRRTKEQLRIARLKQETAAVAEGAAKLESYVAVAPPSDMLGKVSRAILGKLAQHWPDMLGANKFPVPFSVTVTVMGYEAVVALDYERTVSDESRVLLDDGEQDLPLTAEAPAAPITITGQTNVAEQEISLAAGHKVAPQPVAL